MSAAFTYFSHWRWAYRCRSLYPVWSMLAIVLVVSLTSACTRFSPTDRQRDLAAEKMVARLRQTNLGLTGFKCVGKMTLAGSDKPRQSFRAAMAGVLSDHLRIDMFAPFGGSAGTFASDGKNLFLVMHPSREYYKKRFGKGSLRRLVQIEITVGDLMELLVGRIPLSLDFFARLEPDETGAQTHLIFVDRRDRIRQRITFDDALQPVRSQWFDNNQNAWLTLTLDGQLLVDGFVLPRRFELSAKAGDRVSVVLDRYEANVHLDESLFVVVPPSS